jgi:hypothetical protein
MNNLFCFWTGFTGFYGSFLPFIPALNGTGWKGKKIMYIMLIPGPDLVFKIQYLLLSSLKNQ